MPLQIPHRPNAVPLPLSLLETVLDRHVRRTKPRLDQLWAYYRNAPCDTGADGRPALAQARGLPLRLRRPGGDAYPRTARELVIENDIAWRVHTLVDFMFGRPVALQSTAPDPTRAALLERFLRSVFEHNGGVSFFQDLGLLGCVYGHADVLVRVASHAEAASVAAGRASGDVESLARHITLDLVDATRGIPVVDPRDYRRLVAYVLHVAQPAQESAAPGGGADLLMRLHRRVFGGGREDAPRRAAVERTQVWSDASVAEYIASPRAPWPWAAARRLVGTQINRLGRIPVVHIQNLPQPLYYEGLSEVEPLIPLQDELNTRLSDRANRITFQCFKMYLGRGIDGFIDRPVGPGQMWATENLQASIQEFGGDSSNPSESEHITEIREAMDKTSGVTPLAAGVLRDKVGNLTSENALRITMMGLLAKTLKKRVTYGSGIARVCELILHAADVYGLVPNAPDERTVRLDWSDPLPTSEAQQLQNAKLKLDLGIPRKQVLTELGYADCTD